MRKLIAFDFVKLKKIETSHVQIIIRHCHSHSSNESEILKQVVKAVENSPLILDQITVLGLCPALVKPLCQVLENSKTLHTLNVTSGDFGVIQVFQSNLKEIFQLIQASTSIKELSIDLYLTNYSQITRALFEMIKHNRMIHTLTLNAEMINQEYELVAQSLLKNFALQNLSINDPGVVYSLNEAIRHLTEDEKVQLHPNWKLRIY